MARITGSGIGIKTTRNPVGRRKEKNAGTYEEREASSAYVGGALKALGQLEQRLVALAVGIHLGLISTGHEQVIPSC